MAEVNFTVESWSAWSTSKTQLADWSSWANNQFFTATEMAPDISMIPAMKRRRMSSLTKMAFATALDCVKDTDEHPNCIFASQHGELTRTVKILNTLVDMEDVSPTDFSLSVHNTALGLFSIHTHNKQPATTVAAGEDSFGYGLLEAAILLARFPDTPVLLVFFDEPLPQPLSKLLDKPEEAISIALLLSSRAINNSVDIKIAMNFNHVEKNTAVDNSAEAFLKFLLSESPIGQAKTARMNWQWEKIQ